MIRRALLTLTLALALGACDTVRTFLGTDEEEIPLPGERISALELERSLAPDPRIADLAVQLPQPYLNAEWPQAGGFPSHAMHHLALEGNLDPVWRTSIGEGSTNKHRLLVRPVVAAGKVFVVDAVGRIAAHDAATGARVWRFSLRPSNEEGDNASGGGIAYDRGVLYVTSGFGEVLAMDAESGAQIWRRNIGTPLRAPPTVTAGRVYVLTYDNQLFALSSRTGDELWNNPGIGEEAGLLGGAAPAVEGNLVVVPQSSGELVALRTENGREAWSDTLVRKTPITPLAALSDINGAPVIDRGMVFAVSHGGRFVAVELQSGARVWERNFSGTETPWVAGDFLYVLTSESELVCLSRRDGRIRWVTPLPRYVNPEERKDPIYWSGPVLAGDRVIVASNHGVMYSLSPYNGILLGQSVVRDGASLAPVVADGMMFILTDEGELIAFR